MLTKLRCWWWQLLVGAPFMPWMVIHHADWTYDIAKDDLNWEWQIAGFATTMLTLAMLALIGVGFARAHIKEEW